MMIHINDPRRFRYVSYLMAGAARVYQVALAFPEKSRESLRRSVKNEVGMLKRPSEISERGPWQNAVADASYEMLKLKVPALHKIPSRKESCLQTTVEP